MQLGSRGFAKANSFLEIHMSTVYWSVGLLLVGLLIVFLELFIPSAGVLGILAAICLISAIIVAFLHSVTTGLIVLLVTLVAVPILLAIMVKIWPHTPIGRRVMIGKMKAEEVMPQNEVYTEIKNLVGQLGVAKTKMLPSGSVVINDRKYDALSDGFAIEAGQAIKVSAVKGNRILVQPYEGENDPTDLPARDRDVLSQPIEGLGLGDIDIDELE